MLNDLRRPPSIAAEAPEEEPLGGKHRPPRAESAISVNFEDYANTPDDGTGAVNAASKLDRVVIKITYLLLTMLGGLACPSGLIVKLLVI